MQLTLPVFYAWSAFWEVSTETTDTGSVMSKGQPHTVLAFMLDTFYLILKMEWVQGQAGCSVFHPTITRVELAG